MKAVLIAFLALGSQVVAQNSLGRPTLSDTSLTEVRPATIWSQTTEGAALSTAYLDFSNVLASFTTSAPSVYYDKLRVMVLNFGRSHIKSYQSIMSGVQNYKTFFSKVRNADFAYKSRYASMMADLSVRTVNSTVNATFTALQPSIQSALRLVGNLSTVNASLFANQQVLNKTMFDFRNQADVLLTNISQVIYMQNRDQANEITGIITDVKASITDKRNQLSIASTNIKTRVNNLYNNLNTNYGTAITSYLDSLIQEKADQINAVKTQIDTLKAALDTESSSYQTNFMTSANTFKAAYASFEANKVSEINNLLSDSGNQMTALKNGGFQMLAQFRHVTTYTRYAMEVMGYANKLAKWIQDKSNFDLDNLFNFQSAYTNQINQIFANYEALGLYTNQLVKQIDSTATAYKRIFVSKPFRLGEWAPINADAFPAALSAAQATRFKFFKIRLTPIDTTFTESTKNYRVHVKNDDKNLSFEVFDAISLVTAGTDAEKGLWCFIAVTDPVAAMDKVICSLQYAVTFTGIVDSTSVVNNPTLSSVEIPLVWEVPAVV